MNKKKILNYAVGPIGVSLLSFISLPIITWFYTIEDVGKISMLQVFSSLATLFFCLGLDQAYTREYHENKDKPKLFKQSFSPGFILLLFFLSLVYIIDNEIISLWLYSEKDEMLSIITIACFLLAFCSRFLSLILRMQERALAYSMSQLLPKLFFLIFILVIVWLGFESSFFSLISAHLLAIFIVFFVFILNTRRYLRSSITKALTKEELKPLLNFGLPLVIAGLSAWGLKVVDKLFLRGLSTFSELGLYSVAISIAGVATIFSGIFNTIWTPLVYKWVSNKSIDYHKINGIHEAVLAIIYFSVIITGFFSWILPYLFPEGYEELQHLIALCFFAPLLYTLSEVSAVGISIVKKTKYSMYISVIALAVNIVGNYTLIPLYGALGAAISTTLSFWLFYIMRTECSRRVWYNIPVIKSYLVTLLLLLVLVFNALILDQGVTHFYTLFLLFLLGIVFFKKSILLLCNKKVNP